MRSHRKPRNEMWRLPAFSLRRREQPCIGVGELAAEPSWATLDIFGHALLPKFIYGVDREQCRFVNDVVCDNPLNEGHLKGKR